VPLDRRLSRLATAQDGVVTRRQLLDLGLTPRAVGVRLANGSLSRLFRGVYAVGHAAVPERGWMRAALLSVGDGAVLSHDTATRARGIGPASSTLHVTVAGRRPRSRAGLRVHAVAALAPADRTVHRGLPLTSMGRTLLDLAATAGPGSLDAALWEARVRRLVTDGELAAAIARAPRQHPGVAALRRMTTSPGAAPTRSQLERRFLRLVAQAGLPRPLVNAAHGRDLVDFTWPDHRVVVEVDGWAAHGTREAFEIDRARDADRQSGGFAVLRFTWRQVTERATWVIARLALVLGARASSLTGAP
jgi:Protein of unknown function (DUF559)